MAEVFVKIELWSFHLDGKAGRAGSHPMDAARAAQISDPARRLRYQRGRAALRSVLGIHLGINPENVTFEIAPGGKPRIAGCEFSISHSGPWLVVAISDAAVGVDIETLGRRRNVMGLAERFFSARDLGSLRETPEARRDHVFIRQWVAKEAAIKCDGAGLAFHLHKAECVMDGAGIPGVRWDEQRFSIHEFALSDDTPGAVAWRGGDKAHIEWRDAAEIDVS